MWRSEGFLEEQKNGAAELRTKHRLRDILAVSLPLIRRLHFTAYILLLIGWTELRLGKHVDFCSNKLFHNV